MCVCEMRLVENDLLSSGLTCAMSSFCFCFAIQEGCISCDFSAAAAGLPPPLLHQVVPIA